MTARPLNTRKIALVTGAARRIGQTIALTLARAGWHIGVHYRHSHAEAMHTVALIQSLGQEAVALQADLADMTQVSDLIPQLTAAIGPVSCLINNASCFEFDVIDTFTATSFLKHMLPNLAAPMVLAQHLQRALPADTPGVIVNLLDQKLWAYNPDFLSYSLSKAGLAAATTMLAQALAPAIRVVGVAPGLTLPSPYQTAAQFAHAHHHTAPLGHCSRPEDIADSVLFAVNNASITGTTIVCDGGQHLRPLARDVSFMS